MSTLDWRGPDWLHEVDEGEVILISHNRQTWVYRPDLKRITCVVVYRNGDKFKEFGSDSFEISSIVAWARFDPPANVVPYVERY